MILIAIGFKARFGGLMADFVFQRIQLGAKKTMPLADSSLMKNYGFRFA